MEFNLKQYYSELSDEKLLYIINYEFCDLQPLAKEVALLELKKRELDFSKNATLAHMQDDGIDDKEVLQIATFLQRNKCPICKNESIPNGFYIHKHYSLLLFRIKKQVFYFGCRKCLLKQQKMQILINVVASIPSVFVLALMPFELIMGIIQYWEIAQIDFAFPTKYLIDNIKSNVKYYRDIVY